jgi:recombination protein RecA
VRLASGIPALDELLHGGLPTAVLTELVGPEGSGRTTLALAYAAAVTHAGSVCAWIDVADALDPETVAANGVDLERLLWIRCDTRQPSASHSALEAVQVLSIRNSSEPSAPRHTGGGSPHPRSEGRGMPEAITAMLASHGGLYDHQARRERKAIGTPGMPNRPLATCPLANRSPHREEQVTSDRLPARRGENLANLALTPRCAEPQPRRIASLPSSERTLIPLQKRKRESPRTPWQALDQALRATDLLLQNGGFSAIILDLGSTPAETAWRIPQATWFRFRSACERTRATLLLLTQHPCAGSSAELVLRLAPGTLEAENDVVTGIRYTAAIERTRSPQNHTSVVPIRKPPQSVRPGQWKSEAAWAR